MLASFLILADAHPGMPTSSSKEPSRSRVQMRRLETELSREKQKFELFNIKENDLLSRLSSMEEEVAGKRIELTSIKREIRISESKIRSLKREKADFEKSLRAVEEKLMERLVALYKYTRRGYMKIVATATDLDQFRLRVKYLKAIMLEDRMALQALVQEKLAQEKKIALLSQQLSQTQSRRNQAEKRLSALKKDLEEKVILLMKTHREKEFYQTAIKELEAGAESLKSTLLDLEKRPGKYGGEMGISAFVEKKGHLPLPFKGKVLRGTKVLGVSAGRIRRGVYIEGKGDEEVRSIFPGRVDFSGRLKGYGEMIIINHGSRFFTVSAELTRRMKKKGDRVACGTVIGLVGSQEKSGLTRLYFEIRHGEAILDPMKWLKIH